MASSSNEPLPGPPDPWRASEQPAFRSRPPYLMTEMIGAEPALAERLVRRLRAAPAVTELVAAVRAAADAGSPIVVTGCGTSEHAGIGVAAMLGEALDRRAGTDVQAVPALTVLRRPPTSGVVLAISHEGGTAVTNAAMEAARGAGARTALVTVSDRSPGAGIAEIVVTTEEQDQSWCHTVGYLSPLIAGTVIASKVGGTRLDAPAIRALLEVAADPRATANVVAGLAGIDRLLVVGGGADWVSSCELVLKVVEGARLPADAVELETVLHGTLAASTRWTGLVLVLTDPTVVEAARDRLLKVLAAARALSLPTAAIVAEGLATEVDASLTPAGQLVVPQTGRVRGVASSLLGAAIPLQLLAERLARARGVDPDTLGREDPAQSAAHA